MKTAALLLSVLCAPAIAHAIPDERPAEPPPAEPPPEPAQPVGEPPVAQPPAPVVLPTIQEDLDDQADQISALRKEAEKQQRINDSLWDEIAKTKHLQRSIGIAAFVDIGAFAVAGNGAGIRSDFLHEHYPNYSETIGGRWVFMGDPFTTMINSLGDPAEIADSREVENDAINSSGRPSVIVNSIGLMIGKNVRDDISIKALAQLLPRPGDDRLEISYGYVRYKPSPKRAFYLDAGKIDSVLGREYRTQDSPSRLTVTPSLICRYTCGRPIGVDARYEGERTNLSAAIINGDNFEERFSPDDELRANSVPSIAGHIERKFPVGQKLWIGASGAIGPQDGQSSLDVMQWHFGFDLRLIDLKGWDVTAEYVQGRQQGSTSSKVVADRMAGVDRAGCDVAECLDYKGAYVLVNRRLDKHWEPYTRFDWRQATHQRGADFVYEARSVRGTFGVQVLLNSHVLAKVEYIWNHELGVPSFPHDVITSSIVVKTD